jgi:hypothetical protein
MKPIQLFRLSVAVPQNLSLNLKIIGENGSDAIVQRLSEITQVIRADTILESIPPHSKRLNVIPHGVSCGIPFSALPCDLKQDIDSKSPKLRTYFLDRFSLGIMCVHSQKMLQWSEDRGSNLRFAPLLQGMALHKQNAALSKLSADGKETAHLDAEYSCLRKSLGKLSIEYQVGLQYRQEIVLI